MVDRRHIKVGLLAGIGLFLAPETIAVPPEKPAPDASEQALVVPPPSTPAYPKISGPVQDTTGRLIPSDVEHIATRLVNLRAEHGVHMAVLVVETTGGVPILSLIHI